MRKVIVVLIAIFMLNCAAEAPQQASNTQSGSGITQATNENCTINSSSVGECKVN